MSHLLETGMFVREVPWHGLGTIVEDAPTSADAIRLAELDWNVLSTSIYDPLGHLIEGYKANMRDKDNSVLGIVSDKYQIVQNAEAFEFTDSLLENGDIRYETAGSLRKGKQIWLLAKMPQQQILDDAFDPYICFTNTHDGTGAIRVCMTPIRVVCNNTLNLALSTAKRSWSTKHIGDIAGKLVEAKQTLGFAQNYMTELSKKAEILADKKISEEKLEAILDEMFPIDYVNDKPRKINNIEKLKDNFYACYYMPDIKQFRGTAWGVVNAMSDMVGHTAPTRNTSTYQENNWGRIMVGHPFVDEVVKRVTV